MKRLLIILLCFITLQTFGQGTNVVHMAARPVFAAAGGGVGDEPSHWSTKSDGHYVAEAGNFTLTGTSGDSISQWNDETGNGNHLTQSTMENRPIFDTDSVYFDGTNDDLSWRVATCDDTLSQPFTLYAVMKIYTYNANTSIITLGGDLCFSLKQLRTDNSAPTLRLRGDGSPSITDNNMTVGDYILVRFVYNGTSSELQINNNAATTGDAGTEGIESVVLGNSTVYKELMWMNDTETSGEQADSETYFNNKYSLW